MLDNEKVPTLQEVVEQMASQLVEDAKNHPEICEKLGEILKTLDNIIGNLDAENADPKLVTRQLSAAVILLDGVQTRGSYVGEIPETEPGVSFVDQVAKSVRTRVERTKEKKGKSLPDWEKKHTL